MQYMCCKYFVNSYHNNDKNAAILAKPHFEVEHNMRVLQHDFAFHFIIRLRFHVTDKKTWRNRPNCDLFKKCPFVNSLKVYGYGISRFESVNRQYLKF